MNVNTVPWLYCIWWVTYMCLSQQQYQIAKSISSKQVDKAFWLLSAPQLLQKYPSLGVCSHFHLNPELISFIMDALLAKQPIDPLTLRELVQRNSGKIIGCSIAEMQTSPTPVSSIYTQRQPTLFLPLMQPSSSLARILTSRATKVTGYWWQTNSICAIFSSAQDSLEDCFYDWLALGHYTGFCCAKVPNGHKQGSYPRSGSVKITMHLVLWSMMIGSSLTNKQVTSEIKQQRQTWETFIELTFAGIQKNGQNGKIISYWRNNIDPRVGAQFEWLGVFAWGHIAWAFAPWQTTWQTPRPHQRAHCLYRNATEVETLLRNKWQLNPH
jgi:hypothetical protein